MLKTFGGGFGAATLFVTASNSKINFLTIFKKRIIITSDRSKLFGKLHMNLKFLRSLKKMNNGIIFFSVFAFH